MTSISDTREGMAKEGFVSFFVALVALKNCVYAVNSVLKRKKRFYQTLNIIISTDRWPKKCLMNSSTALSFHIPTLEEEEKM